MVLRGLFPSAPTTRPIAISCVLRAISQRPTDGPTDGRTDKATYRVACKRLKKSILLFSFFDKSLFNKKENHSESPHKNSEQRCGRENEIRFKILCSGWHFIIGFFLGLLRLCVDELPEMFWKRRRSVPEQSLPPFRHLRLLPVWIYYRHSSLSNASFDGELFSFKWLIQLLSQSGIDDPRGSVFRPKRFRRLRVLNALTDDTHQYVSKSDITMPFSLRNRRHLGKHHYRNRSLLWYV